MAKKQYSFHGKSKNEIPHKITSLLRDVATDDGKAFWQKEVDLLDKIRDTKMRREEPDGADKEKEEEEMSVDSNSFRVCGRCVCVDQEYTCWVSL